MTHFFRLIDGHNQQVDCSVVFMESGKHITEKVCVQVFFVALLTQKCSVSADTILSGRSCQSFMVAGKKDNCPQCSTGYGQAVWNALSSV